MSAGVKAAPTQVPSIYDLTLKELMDVSVITAASGFEQRLDRAPANATVITKEQWQSRGAYTLSDALEAVAGLHITEPVFNFNHTIFMIRGLSGSDGEQVKLLIDGQPMEWMQTGGRPLGFDMPLSNFERIEVIKGPGSVVYGADAFAGVINLVSYKGMLPDTRFSVSAGAFDTYSLSFLTGIKTDEYQLSLALDYLRSNDDPDRLVTSDLQTTLDQLTGSNASNAPGRIDEHMEVLSLMLSAQWQALTFDIQSMHNFDIGLGGGIAQALDDKGSASWRHDRLTATWDLANLVEMGKFELSGSYARGETKTYLYVFPAGSLLPIGADGNVQFVDFAGMTYFPDGLIGTPSNVGETYHLSMTRLLKFEQHQVRWQLGYEYQDFHVFERKNFGPGVLDGSQNEVSGTLTDITGTELIYLPDISRRFYYLSLHDEWELNEQLILSSGIRYDRYSDFGSTTNPRVSLLYRPDDALSINLFAGTAFRAPAFAELYVQNNPVLLGNDQLKPEGVKTTEVGLGIDYWFNDNLLFSADVFDYYADDLVRYVYDATLNYEVAQNIGVQKGQGGELSLQWKPTKALNINGHFAYVDTQDQQGFSIAGVPKQMWYLDLYYRFKTHWRWYVDGKWIKDRARSRHDIRAPIKDYFLMNSTLSYSGLAQGVTLSLAIKNLFDRDAREPSDGSIAEDYPQPGRQWLLGLEYRF